MTNLKNKANILVVGPNGSGKTTFLNTLSMAPIVEVDYRSSEEIVENDTPNGVEYGAFITPNVDVELRALPALSTNDMNWAVASEGIDAVMMLVPSDDPRSFLAAHKMLDAIEQRLDVPFLLALTRSDEGLTWDHSEVADCFHIPEEFIVTIDSRNYQSSFDALNYLFEYVPATVEEEEYELARCIA